MDTRIKYGIISGAIATGLSLLTYAIGLDARLSYAAQEIVGYLSMLLALLVIVLAILQVRKQQGGYISFSKAFGTGMVVALIGGVVFGIGITIMLSFAGEEYFIELMAKAKDGIMASDMPEVQKELKIAEMDMMANSIFMKPWFSGILMFLHMIFIGLIVSLITSLALMRNQ